MTPNQSRRSILRTAAALAVACFLPIPRRAVAEPPAPSGGDWVRVAPRVEQDIEGWLSHGSIFPDNGVRLYYRVFPTPDRGVRVMWRLTAWVGGRKAVLLRETNARWTETNDACVWRLARDLSRFIKGDAPWPKIGGWVSEGEAAF